MFLNHRIIGWKRPPRSSSPTIHPTTPCLLIHIPKCHIYTFFKHLQGWRLNHRITESQNSRGWKGPLWVIQSNPPAEAGSSTAGCTGPCPLHNLPGQPVPVLRHPQREEVLPHVQTELPVPQFVPIAPCPVTGNH